MLWRKFHLNWRYAIGEFAIVMLSVLAALAVDNWNSDRIDRRLEREYIQSLLEDLKTDDQSIDIAMREAELYARFGITVLRAIDEQEIDVPPAEFARALSQASYLTFATYSRRTIDDLMSTGNLRLIESEEVQKGISDYYTRIASSTQWQQTWRGHQGYLGTILPELIDLRIRQISSAANSNFPPPWADRDGTVSESEARAILERLTRHPDAKHAIENMVRIQGLSYTRAGRVRRRLHELIDTVESYLDQLEGA